MAELYSKDKGLYFGPVAVNIGNEEDSKEVIKQGMKGIQEKLKETQQKFLKAVVGCIKVEVIKLYLSFMTRSFPCGVIQPILSHLRCVKGDDFNETEENLIS